ncbi:MAG: RHS repeat-associated core domain-containing protein, partial [Coriobacteriia bacterium]|nr:RHS repeat-associated core domain-containing protein [Coriobacteriia bacterium]
GSLSSTIGELNPFRYRGYYYDSETGLYYLNARYYDPEVGRFLNADSQLNPGYNGKNLYAFCENNTVNLSDPTGKGPGDRFLTMNGAAIDSSYYLYELGTFRDGWEYSVSIYELSYTCLVPVYRVVQGKTQIYLVEETTIYYSYTVAYTDRIRWGVDIPDVPEGTVRVAVNHTHVFTYGHNYHAQYSDLDTGYAARENVTVYLYHAEGVLLRYDPPNEENPDGRVIVIMTDLPQDPHYLDSLSNGWR